MRAFTKFIFGGIFFPGISPFIPPKNNAGSMVTLCHNVPKFRVNDEFTAFFELNFRAE